METLHPLDRLTMAANECDLEFALEIQTKVWNISNVVLLYNRIRVHIWVNILNPKYNKTWKTEKKKKKCIMIALVVVVYHFLLLKTYNSDCSWRKNGTSSSSRSWCMCCQVIDRHSWRWRIRTRSSGIMFYPFFFPLPFFSRHLVVHLHLL